MLYYIVSIIAVLFMTCMPVSAAPALNLGTATASGTVVFIPVILANVQGTSIAAIDAYIVFNRVSTAFAVKMNGGTPVSASEGPAALAAGKQVSQSLVGGKLHITVFGLNMAAIPDGVVAQLSFDIQTAATSNMENFAIYLPTASSPDGRNVSITGSGTPAPSNQQISVIKNGNGTGSVTTIPAGIVCNSNACSADYYLGSTVVISALPGSASSIGPWAGDCSGTGACSVAMTASRSATANFLLSNTVQLGADKYGSLSGAYAVAPAQSVIQTREVTFIEDLTLNRAIPVTIKGGCDSTFASCSGYTTINGTLTIRKGSLVAERLRLQ
jgi:hypothetical protein